MLQRLVSAAILIATPALGWGLPGLLANDYRKGDMLRIMVSKIESQTTNMNYNYYDAGFQRPDEDDFVYF